MSQSCAFSQSCGAVDRRGFISQTALALAGAALAACSGGSDATAPTSISSETIKLSDYPALASTGGVALVTIGGSPFALVRTSSTTVVALSRICPHQGATVNAVSTGFTCPRHGARFDQSGTWIGGERTSSMRSYPTTLDTVAGTVTVG